MTLPSQTGRVSGPSARVTRKRRRGKRNRLKLPLLLLVVCVGGYFVWDFWLRHEEPSEQPTTDTYNAPTSEMPPRIVVPNRIAPKPSSYMSPVPDEVEDDPLVYDKPAPARLNTADPLEVALPQIPTQPVKANALPSSIKPTIIKPQNLSSELDGQDIPKPVPGTPVLGPVSPVKVQNTDIAQLITQAQALVKQGRPLKARAQLSDLILERFSELSKNQANTIRSELKKINQDLVFSKRVIQGDPIAQFYVVQTGDYLGPIAKRYHVTYPLLEQINHVKATRIWVGMKLKVIKGPFHVIIDKSGYLMDVYVKDAQGKKVFIATYPVGLGEEDSTPIGMWRVRAGSKVQNPAWPDPRTGKVYQPDDPKNPIGEYWIGIEGSDGNTQGKKGYGIHGTTDVTSIGQQRSMGCIRMRADDLNILYSMLVDKYSTVQIRR